jgi:plastocyanin
MSRISPRLPVVLAILVLGACTVERTNDDGGTPPPGDVSVEVQLAEFSIELPDSVAAGTVSFNITNNGEMEHSFAIAGGDFEDELTDALAPGGTFTYTAELAPGTYTVWCPIGNHREEGMEATIEVTEGAASSGAPLFDEGVDPSEQEAPITDDYSAP